MGVFSKDKQPVNKMKRNTVDKSRQNNLTMRFGGIYPCLCEEVLSGDTWHIDIAAGLRFMPTYFPLQTKMRCSCDLFYVRNRNLWGSFKNYLFRTGSPDSFPVLSKKEAIEQSKTGSLGDYLGLPSTIVGKDDILLTARPQIPMSATGPDSPWPAFSLSIGDTQIPSSSSLYACWQFFNRVIVADNGDKVLYRDFAVSSNTKSTSSSDFYYCTLSDILSSEETLVESGHTYYRLPQDEPFSTSGYTSCVPVIFHSSDYTGYTGTSAPLAYTYLGRYRYSKDLPICIVRDGYVYVLDSYVTYSDSSTRVFIAFVPRGAFYDVAFPTNLKTWNGPGIDDSVLSYMPSRTVKASDYTFGVVEATEVFTEIPYDISALPFRAYEQIYNAFYRDDRNNPYYNPVTGEYDPNSFLPTTDGGDDFNQYRIRYRNWEQDFLTTAMPSPQFGVAPLVGLTSTGVATFEVDGVQYTSQLKVGEDGDTMEGFSTTPNSTVNRTLVNLSNQGISINDLRGVNSLQRWLEANLRRGLRYRDQIYSHYGVKVGYDELDMPEFIGSFNLGVDVTQINQTTNGGESDPLGSYAGQLSAVGGSKKKLHKYCDEPGYIIAVISVTPVPCYSQLVPKHFLKTKENLDFYSPEFAYLGMQPITYEEVCPFQAANQGIPLTNVFGYQKAWYDYLSAVDEVHGQFRTTLNHFVLSRVYNQVPSLNEDFLVVKPDSLNDVFSVSEADGEPLDTILGQVHLDIAVERPIPLYGVPRLE